MKSMSKMNKVIFQSYTDVINKGMRAGRDMSLLSKRLNHLMSEHKKTIYIDSSTEPGLFLSSWFSFF